MEIYNRYAKAFIELADSDKQTSDIIKVKKLLTKEVQNFLKNPIASTKDKEKIVDCLTKNEHLKSFLKFMISKNRTDFISCFKAYERILDKKNNVIRGKVISKNKLSEDKKKSLEKTFSNKFNKNVNFHYELDSSVLGGLKVIFGEVIFEDTLKARLAKIGKIREI